ITEIQTKLGRYCTYSVITASDMQTQLTEVTCLINRLEEQKLKEIINTVDPKAYIAIYEAADYHVGNIKKEDVH
ncbi:DUF2179 domain-containing protein, partial [Mammaliicoccus vitulinus]